MHANEVILTLGRSHTTEAFLKEAAKKREFQVGERCSLRPDVGHPAQGLLPAWRGRGLQVVVAEGAPRYNGHLMARKLAEAGIQTTVIADASVFAMMARANKVAAAPCALLCLARAQESPERRWLQVLVGAHAVLANGSIIASCGTHMVALAARHFSVPFVVLVGLHKLSPQFPYDPQVAFNGEAACCGTACSAVHDRALLLWCLRRAAQPC